MTEAQKPAAPTGEREAFEAQFPMPRSVAWSGSTYEVRDEYENSYSAERYCGQWEAWQARAALRVHLSTALTGAQPAPAAQPADSAMEVLRELVELQGSEPAVDDLVDGTWLAWDAKRTAAWERARALTRQGDAA